MLDRIVDALRECKVDFDGVMLAELLWLDDSINGVAARNSSDKSAEYRTRPDPSEDETDPCERRQGNQHSACLLPGLAGDAEVTLSSPIGPLEHLQSDIAIPVPQCFPVRQAMNAALGALMVRDPRPAFSLDVNATVEAIAEANGVLVKPRPAAGERRWLRLVFITETGPQTPIWNSTLREIERLFRDRGAFRSVARFTLTTASGMSQLVAADTNYAHWAREAIWHRNALVVVASDFVSSHWWSGLFASVVCEWRRSHHVLLLHLLPRSLWRQTWVGNIDMQISGQVPGGPSASLLAAPIRAHIGRTQITDTSAAATAVAQLSADDFSAWASVVVAESGKAPAIRLASRLTARRSSAFTLKSNADDRVAAFQARASRQAVQLGRYLSLIAPLNLQMMQWVQRALVPESETGHLAEFFLGGLLRRVSGSADENTAIYDFVPGVRERISQQMEIAHALDVMRQVGAFLQKQLRLENDPFLVVRAGQIGMLSKESLPVQGFARVTQEYLQRAGLLPTEPDIDVAAAASSTETYDQVAGLSELAGVARTEVPLESMVTDPEPPSQDFALSEGEIKWIGPVLAAQLEAQGYHPIVIFGSVNSGKSTFLASLLAFFKESVNLEIGIFLGGPILPMDTAYGRYVWEAAQAFFHRSCQEFIDGMADQATKMRYPFFVPVIVRPKNKPEMKFAFLESSGEWYQADRATAQLYPRLKGEIEGILRHFQGGISVVYTAPFTQENVGEGLINSSNDRRQIANAGLALVGVMETYESMRVVKHSDRHLFLVTKWDGYSKDNLTLKEILAGTAGDAESVAKEKYTQAFAAFKNLALKADQRTLMQYCAGLIVGRQIIRTNEELRPIIDRYRSTIWNWLYRNASVNHKRVGSPIALIPEPPPPRKSLLGRLVDKLLS